jgi:hypothetical protein
MKMFLRPEHPDFWLVWTEIKDCLMGKEKGLMTYSGVFIP